MDFGCSWILLNMPTCFWTIFDRFGHLLGPFYGSALALFEPFWGSKRDQNSVIFWGDFGRFSGRSGSFWGHFMIVLASFLGRFGAFLTLLTGFRPKPGQFGVLCQKNALKP